MTPVAFAAAWLCPPRWVTIAGAPADSKLRISRTSALNENKADGVWRRCMACLHRKVSTTDQEWGTKERRGHSHFACRERRLWRPNVQVGSPQPFGNLSCDPDLVRRALPRACDASTVTAPGASMRARQENHSNAPELAI